MLNRGAYSRYFRQHSTFVFYEQKIFRSCLEISKNLFINAGRKEASLYPAQWEASFPGRVAAKAQDPRVVTSAFGLVRQMEQRGLPWIWKDPRVVPFPAGNVA